MNIMYLVYYYTIGKPMEQDLLKAFGGGAYVNASLAIITKLGGVQVLVKYFISPPFCRIHKRCCLAPGTVKPILHKTEQICGRVGTNYKTKLSCVCWSHNTGDDKGATILELCRFLCLLWILSFYSTL
jgi:hypothetical protein